MSNAKNMNLGKHMVVVGLLIQIIFFGFFVVTAGIFHYRIARNPTPASVRNNWKKYIFALYAASVLILIRSAFRVVEFSMGNDGVPMRNEVFLYIFDASLMLPVMVIFNLAHPGHIMGRNVAVGEAIQLDGESIEESARLTYDRK